MNGTIGQMMMGGGGKLGGGNAKGAKGHATHRFDEHTAAEVEWNTEDTGETPTARTGVESRFMHPLNGKGKSKEKRRGGAGIGREG